MFFNPIFCKVVKCSFNKYFFLQEGDPAINLGFVDFPLAQQHIKVEDSDYDDHVHVIEVDVIPPNVDVVLPNVEVVPEASSLTVLLSKPVTPTTTAKHQSHNQVPSPELPVEEVVDDELTADEQSECSTTIAETPQPPQRQHIIQQHNQQQQLSSVENEEVPPSSELMNKNLDTGETQPLQQQEEDAAAAAQASLKRTYTLETKVLRETRVFVHSIILAAKSEFFKCLFSTSGMKETSQQEVKLEVGRNETDIMLTMLRCFYNRNHINLQSLECVVSVCYMSMKYCFDGLIDRSLDVFAARAGQITAVDELNRINVAVDRIKTGFNQHKAKCALVQSKFHEFVLNNFQKLDECLEATPCKLFEIRLEAMGLFLSPLVQRHLCNDRGFGNLFLYAMQRWIRNHASKNNLNSNDETSVQMKKDTITFIEKLMKSVSLAHVTSDFLTNVLNHEICVFNMWPGYKEWYIRALQNHIHEKASRSAVVKNYPLVSRKRELRYTRQEKMADIFSMTPIILNGFEIGIYLRIREDRKVHMLCKCKNFVQNRVGFDKALLTFSIKGLLKLNTNSALWKEPFPRQFNSHPAAAMFTDRFTFSYKQNTMCLQMYSLCKLSPAVYNIAKRSGFLVEFDVQLIH